jgi:hypothetical protein
MVFHEIRVVQAEVLTPHPSVIVVIRLDGGNLPVLASDLMNTVTRAAVDDASRVDYFLSRMERGEFAHDFLA